MTSRVFTDPRPQQFKSDGVSINSNGKLYFYEPGAGSTTLKAIYADSALTVQLANPVILSSSGRFPTIYLQDSDYAVLHTDSADVQIWRVDNYQPDRFETQFQDWDSTFTYAVNDFVRYTDGKYYISLQSSNLNNVPPSTPAFWSELAFFEVYNSSKTYNVGDPVFYQNSIYISQSPSNSGNTPSFSSNSWSPPPARQQEKNGSRAALGTYYVDDTTSQETFDVDLSVAASTWESIGPAASSPDNTWSAMNDMLVSEEARSIILGVEIETTKTTGADAAYDVTLTFRKNGGTRVFNGPVVKGFGGSTVNHHGSNSMVIEVPVSSDELFDVRWVNNGADTVSITLLYYGYKAFVTEA